MQRIAAVAGLFWLMAMAPAAEVRSEEPTIDPKAALAAHGQEFDFMIGKWLVLGKDGERRAHSTWKRLPGQVAAFEEYKDFGTWYAQKFVSFARHEVDPHWVQTSIDGTFQPGPPGYHLLFRGGREDGRMVLYQDGQYYEGERVPENLARCRQIFELREDGTVVYLFEVTYDDGKSWIETSRSTYVPFFGERNLPSSDNGVP
jgi:hypothetical protein